MVFQYAAQSLLGVSADVLFFGESASSSSSEATACRGISLLMGPELLMVGEAVTLMRSDFVPGVGVPSLMGAGPEQAARKKARHRAVECRLID